MPIPTVQHPLLQKRLVDLKLGWVAGWANHFLSSGGACYYISRETLKTRIHLYNYFSLLNAAPFRSRWSLQVYSPDGKHFIERQGEFSEQTTVTVEIDPLAQELGSSLGICLAHIQPQDGGRTLRHSYPTIFFSEYYTENTRGFLHSLGYPIPKLYNANDYMLSSIEEDGDALLLLSNSCRRLFRYPKILSVRGPHIEIQNHKAQKRSFEVPPVPPLGCHAVNLRDVWPDLNAFLEARPASMHIQGPNVLYSPLFLQSGPKGSLAVEHFQGLDWEEL